MLDINKKRLRRLRAKRWANEISDVELYNLEELENMAKDDEYYNGYLAVYTYG